MQNFIKWILLLTLFAPVLYFALRQKKWYLYLACGLIGVLPDQFAVELSKSLPLLTGQRILAFLLLGFWLWQRWKKKNFRISWPLVIYFGVNLLISLVNTRWGIGGEIKRITVMLLEEVMVILMVADMVEDRTELDHCFDVMILSGVAMALIGIVQTIFEFDVASVLKLVDARAPIELTHRMGMIRAFGTTNAIIYGCYCAFVAVLIFYRLERTGKQRYAAALALVIVALISTLSRSSWLCIAGIICLLLITRPKKLLRRIWTSAVMIVILCMLLSCINNAFGNAILQTGRSALNTVLSVVPVQPPVSNEQPVEEDGPILELPENFGENAKNPTRSRVVEWTALEYMIEEGQGLFGYGYNAFLRGKLHYLYPQFGYWIVAPTLDVGLLAVITESGIIGLAALLVLLAYIFQYAFRKRGFNGTFTLNKLMLYGVILYLLLNFMAAFTGPFWVFVGLFFASKKLDKKGITDSGCPAEYTWEW